MADQNQQVHPNDISMGPDEETTDHGCFDFLVRRKEEKPQEDLSRHSTHSHSSSSIEEDEGERKKKQIEVKEKVSSDEEVSVHDDDRDIDEHIEACIPMEKYIAEEHAKAAQLCEKKGFIEKMKDKLPGQNKSSRDEDSPRSGKDGDDKKGIIDMILDKLPGSGSQNKTNESGLY